MTVAGALSFVVGLLALSAFFVVAIVLTIFLVRDTELPEAERDGPQAQSRQL
jgi:hypothetical protein